MVMELIAVVTEIMGYLAMIMKAIVSRGSPYRPDVQAEILEGLQNISTSIQNITGQVTLGQEHHDLLMSQLLMGQRSSSQSSGTMPTAGSSSTQPSATVPKTPMTAPKVFMTEACYANNAGKFHISSECSALANAGPRVNGCSLVDVLAKDLKMCEKCKKAYAVPP